MKKERSKSKLKKEKIVEVKRAVEEWEIWDEEEAAKSEEEAKRLVPPRFHK